MKQFKLVQRVTEYQYCYVEAENREEAKKIWSDDPGLTWRNDDFDGDELIGVDEVTANGENICNDVENGEFLDKEESPR